MHAYLGFKNMVNVMMPILVSFCLLDTMRTIWETRIPTEEMPPSEWLP